MSYERDKLLAGVIETSWREMDRFAGRVARYFNDHPNKDASAMASCLVRAAEDELHEDYVKKQQAAEAKRLAESAS
ncbi:hypothetical protein [Methylobacterium nodulans]|uniref:Uncharacterized protein n=1 Tax=Methylobacterium nodulans (strain LMG 21967 / CNCM I-2342 / ORS 2060) TaxID=460265 RepID=B8ICR4_METNO|nr:hypothetical protein [Methylobacterium nodulans]ACL57475.1 hypothetical protein Mnod_2505 [Methylobacterium nodulans ORS 2060]